MSRPSRPTRASSWTAWTSPPSTRSRVCRRRSPLTRPIRCVQLAIHGRHDDRTQRPPQAVVRARRSVVRPRHGAQAVRHDTPETIFAAAVRTAAQCRTRRAAPGASRSRSSCRLDTSARARWTSGCRSAAITRVQAAARGTRCRSPRTQMALAPANKASGEKVHGGQTEHRTSRGPVRMVKVLDVVADRFRLGQVDTDRVRCWRRSRWRSSAAAGRISVYALGEGAESPEAADLEILDRACTARTATCATPTRFASAFSFNSAVGACETCRGFGRVIGVDYGLVIPNEKLTLRAGAIKPMQTPAWQECQDDLMRHAEDRRHPARHAMEQAHARAPPALGHQRLAELERQMEPALVRRQDVSSNTWRPRPTRCTSGCCCRSTAVTRPCRHSCGGARLKTESLLWRIGGKSRRRRSDGSGAALPAPRC
jgi:excinuclease ABC subunit A